MRFCIHLCVFYISIVNLIVCQLIASLLPWNDFVHSLWKTSWEIDVENENFYSPNFSLRKPKFQISQPVEKSILPVSRLAFEYSIHHFLSTKLLGTQAFFLPHWQNRGCWNLWKIGSVNQETLICFKQRSSFEFF